ncbi:hypothetical protein [Verrucomicrobium sp. BvORR106]|uniref:hypothetical protein n=1 Tax=Verrucomicrobium sp. BvORR106 TaxID=1403819 RepID=UPI00068F0534|nr:hypothetical protein [Verrucomicrobium sp. BvORR106]
MSRLQTSQHQAVRTILRIAGPTSLLIGIGFIIASLIDFFVAFGDMHDEPTLFWCFFVGSPLVFVGFAMTALGFLGSLSRYVAAEQTPVIVDATHDVAQGTQEAVRTVAKAAAEGWKSGLGR